jgi:oxaloacetate decarboxylase alpha subunit
MSSRRYENLSNESLNLILGKYGQLPGNVQSELLVKAKAIGTEENNLNDDELEKMTRELKDLCQDNGIPNLSENIEMVLTYIMFPNIALSFFKELDI